MMKLVYDHGHSSLEVGPSNLLGRTNTHLTCGRMDEGRLDVQDKPIEF